MPIKAVIFDFIGTLVNCKGYNMADSEDKLFSTLVDEGFELEKTSFLNAYHTAHQKYRKVRYEQHKEVTNAVWVSEALCSLGLQVSPEDPRVKAALNVFFQDFIYTLELRSGAKKLLTQTRAQYRVGLISNFTHAPVIHKSLRKLGINQCFNAIVISDENGWRKPKKEIFQEALNRLQAKAEESIYVGDSPLEDIRGARDAGLKTVFIVSQFFALKDIGEYEPCYKAKNLKSVGGILEQIC